MKINFNRRETMNDLCNIHGEVETEELMGGYIRKYCPVCRKIEFEKLIALCEGTTTKEWEKCLDTAKIMEGNETLNTCPDCKIIMQIHSRAMLDPADDIFKCGKCGYKKRRYAQY